MSTGRTDPIRLIILRQDSPQGVPYTEHFAIERRPSMNVISALQAIQRNPVTAEGRKTAPVTWECNCLEEVCGACTMNINGVARQACSALIEQLDEPIRLAPLSKFPVVRDLMVDRAFMFDNLKRVRAWVPIDGTHDLGPGPKLNEHERFEAYKFSRCMTCGCCLEACPQFRTITGEPRADLGKFMGAQVVGQVRLFNAHPTGRMLAAERLDALAGAGGLQDCGNAQNCVQVCPKQIPLTDAIADMGWAITRRVVKRFLNTNRNDV